MVTFMIKWLLMLDVALECCLLAVVYLVHSKQYQQQFCISRTVNITLVMHHCIIITILNNQNYSYVVSI